MPYDGTVRLGVSLSPKDVVQSAKELQKAIEDVFSSSAGKPLDSSLKNIQTQMAKTTQKAAELATEIEAIEMHKADVERAKELKKEIDDLKVAYDELSHKADLEPSPEIEEQLEEMFWQIVNLTNEYDALKNIAPFGEAESAELENYKQKLNDVNNSMTVLLARYQEKNQADKKSAISSKEFGTSIVKAADKGIASMKRLALGILGVRGVYSIIRKATSAYLSANEQLGKKLEMVWTALGQLIGPIIEFLINGFMRLFGYLAAFIKALTGINIAAKANAAALKKQTKAAKDASRQLASFDEMNRLSDQSGGGGGGGGMPSLEMPNVDFRKWLEDAGLGEIVRTFDNLKEILVEFWEKVLVPLGTWAGNELIPAFFNLLNAAFGVLNSLWESIKPSLEWLWDNFLVPIANWTGGLIVEILNELANVLNSISAWMTDNKETMEVIADIVLAFGAAILLVNGYIAISNALLPVSTVLIGLLTGSISLASVATTAFGAAMAFLTSPITLVVLAIGSLIAIIVLCVKHWDEIKVTAIKVWDSIKAAWSAAWSWFKSTVVDPLITGFTNVWNKLKAGAVSAWEGIKNVFSTVASFFKNIFTNAWTAVKNVFSTGGKIFDGIKEGIVSAFKTVVNAIIGGINKVVAIPFNGINTALRAIRDINILGLTPFKNLIKTFSVPQIPYLAKGAVIPPNKEFMAILGDQKSGVNIEAPLDTIVEAFKKVQGDSSQPIIIELKVDGKVLAKATADANKKMGFGFNG